ncbi:hypothetical protein RA2_02867 [Roseovarius sp. A-2]|nr:hypothetical protein RA2_02867 [Roseovarius sp. A-2]
MLPRLFVLGIPNLAERHGADFAAIYAFAAGIRAAGVDLRLYDAGTRCKGWRITKL